MTEREFKAAVERYKAALLCAAAKSKAAENAPGTVLEETVSEEAPVLPERNAENPPEASASGDELQLFAPQPDTFESFRAVNTETGFLRVQAFAGQQTVPVAGAEVLVTHRFGDGVRRFASGQTDTSGVLDSIALPAPRASLSETPSGQMPYALYDVEVRHPDYKPEIFRDVPVFSGVKSIQPVRFLADRSA